MPATVYSTFGTTHRGVILDTPSRTITSRVPHEFSAATDEASATLGMSKSEFIRRSIRSVYEAVIAVMQSSAEEVVSVQAEGGVVEGIQSL